MPLGLAGRVWGALRLCIPSPGRCCHHVSLRATDKEHRCTRSYAVYILLGVTFACAFCLFANRTALFLLDLECSHMCGACMSPLFLKEELAAGDSLCPHCSLLPRSGEDPTVPAAAPPQLAILTVFVLCLPESSM